MDGGCPDSLFVVDAASSCGDDGGESLEKGDVSPVIVLDCSTPPPLLLLLVLLLLFLGGEDGLGLIFSLSFFLYNNNSRKSLSPFIYRGEME